MAPWSSSLDGRRKLLLGLLANLVVVKPAQGYLLNLHGPSLEGVSYLSENRFSIKTVSMIAEQTLSRLKALDKEALVYKIISPRKFMFWTGREQDTIYLTGIIRCTAKAVAGSLQAKIPLTGVERLDWGCINSRTTQLDGR